MLGCTLCLPIRGTFGRQASTPLYIYTYWVSVKWSDGWMGVDGHIRNQNTHQQIHSGKQLWILQVEGIIIFGHLKRGAGGHAWLAR